MELRIFIGDRGKWVVSHYPEITAENNGTFEGVQELQGSGDLEIDMPVGEYTARATWQCDGNLEEPSYFVDLVDIEPVADKLAEILRRIIASADECDVTEGAGVPMVLIDARLIEEARELMK